MYFIKIFSLTMFFSKKNEFKSAGVGAPILLFILSKLNIVHASDEQSRWKRVDVTEENKRINEDLDKVTLLQKEIIELNDDLDRLSIEVKHESNQYTSSMFTEIERPETCTIRKDIFEGKKSSIQNLQKTISLKQETIKLLEIRIEAEARLLLLKISENSSTNPKSRNSLT